MAITHVGSTSVLAESNTSSVNLDLAAAGVVWQPGDVALIRCAAIRPFDIPTGWTEDFNTNPSGAATTTYLGIWRVLQAGDPDVWTLTLAAGQSRPITAGITVRRGVDQTTPIDAQGDQLGEVAPSVVATVDDTAVCRTWYSLNSGGPFTVDPATVERWNQFSATTSRPDIAHADATQATAGATGTATATATSPSGTWALTTVLAPAAGTVPAEGSAAAGIGLALTAAGARTSAGSAAAGLGLSLVAAGSRPSQGTATLSLGLALAGAGLTSQVDSAAGQAAAGLGLQLAAAGTRPSAGAAAFTLGLRLAASTVVVAPTPAERTHSVPVESRTLAVAAESRTLTIPEEDRRVVVS